MVLSLGHHLYVLFFRKCCLITLSMNHPLMNCNPEALYCYSYKSVFLAGSSRHPFVQKLFYISVFRPWRGLTGKECARRSSDVYTRIGRLCVRFLFEMWMSIIFGQSNRVFGRLSEWKSKKKKNKNHNGE